MLALLPVPTDTPISTSIICSIAPVHDPRPFFKDRPTCETCIPLWILLLLANYKFWVAFLWAWELQSMRSTQTWPDHIEITREFAAIKVRLNHEDFHPSTISPKSPGHYIWVRNSEQLLSLFVFQAWKLVNIAIIALLSSAYIPQVETKYKMSWCALCKFVQMLFHCRRMKWTLIKRIGQQKSFSSFSALNSWNTCRHVLPQAVLLAMYFDRFVVMNLCYLLNLDFVFRLHTGVGNLSDLLTWFCSALWQGRALLGSKVSPRSRKWKRGKSKGWLVFKETMHS